MFEGRDPTATYLRLLVFATLQRLLIERPVLQRLLELQDSCNPMNLSDSGSAQDRLAFEQAFEKVLRSKQGIDWNRVKIEIRRLVRFLDEQERKRQQAHSETRWLPLPENNRFFSTERWCSSWSRRDVESLLCFFRDDGFYCDLTLNCSVQKAGLRKLFSQFFHTFEGTVTVTSAKFAPGNGETEIELEWLRDCRRAPATDLKTSLGSGTVRGSSHLWVIQGKISTCIDRSNEEDLERIGRASLGFQRPAGSGTITHTDTTVTVKNIKLLKTIRLKKPSAPSDNE